jgi:Glycogen recognition site of AMP-activated protein kinase
MKSCAYIVIMLVLLLSSTGVAVGQNRNSLTITEDNLILKIDLQSPKSEIDSMLKIAGIGGQYAEKVLKKDFSALNADDWNLVNNENGVAQFNRSLADLNENPQSHPYLITTTIPQIHGKPGYPSKVGYGVNRYAKATVYELASGLTRFILPGNLRANRVFLSGSFNGWSTLKGVMKKMEGGWVIDLKLEPGAYEYKYIVGGRWTTDPNNLVQVDDEAGNVNSIYYKYNHTFKLSGYGNAGKVAVGGDFNEWKQGDIIMEKKGNTWQRQMYLNEGKHLYRFYVDGNGITDPTNPLKEKDESGNLASLIKLGETVYFKLNDHGDAKKVFVAGDFNNWNPGELAMKRVNEAWELPTILSAGNYSYKFIVDGIWITDPLNAHYALEKGQNNSFMSVKPNYTFKIKGFDKAKTIILAGSFDDWDQHRYTMAHDADGWSISFNLKPGKYLYKFIVDGQWILDPGNGFWEPNQFNTGNSVLWIE